MRLTVLPILIAFPFAIYAQTPTGELEQEIETIAEANQEDNTDFIQLAENLEVLRNKTIDLNFADSEDLQQIPYLNIFQIANLLQYRNQTGKIYSAFELALIKGFDQSTIQNILPFINFKTTKTNFNLKPVHIAKYSRHNLLLRSAMDLQTRTGFIPETENGYLGNRQSYYLRYRMQYQNHLSIGFTAQQDAGEPFGGLNSTIDQVSGHIALSKVGNLKQLIIGDFQAEFGQGLALWSSLAFGKGAQTTQIKRFPRGLKAFSGAEENRFLRGVAATYEIRNFKISSFYSLLNIDANLNQTDSNLLTVSSLQSTGMHRTESELLDKDANRLQTIGGNINWTYQSLNLGITALNYQLQLPLIRGEQPYQKFLFTGDELSNFSFDFNYIFGDLNLFGEFALSNNGKLAHTFGIQSNPTDGFYASLLFRNFDKAYHKIYNAPFAETGDYGESGVYLGVSWKVNQLLELRSYLDFYQFEWLRFGVNAPSRGSDFLLQANADLSKYLKAYFRFRSETNETNSTEDEIIKTLTTQQKNSLRLHFAYSLSSQLKLASRIEFSSYKIEFDAKQNGSLVFQDLKFQFVKIPLQLSTRFALVNTDDFNTRIYAYEHDLTYAFSIPAYYGRSARFYLLADFDLNQNLTLQAKYGIYNFFDREEISSGLQQIQGNILSTVSAQVLWKF